MEADSTGASRRFEEKEGTQEENSTETFQRFEEEGTQKADSVGDSTRASGNFVEKEEILEADSTRAFGRFEEGTLEERDKAASLISKELGSPHEGDMTHSGKCDEEGLGEELDKPPSAKSEVEEERKLGEWNQSTSGQSEEIGRLEEGDKAMVGGSEEELRLDEWDKTPSKESEEGISEEEDRTIGLPEYMEIKRTFEHEGQSTRPEEEEEVHEGTLEEGVVMTEEMSLEETSAEARQQDGLEPVRHVTLNNEGFTDDGKMKRDTTGAMEGGETRGEGDHVGPGCGTSMVRYEELNDNDGGLTVEERGPSHGDICDGETGEMEPKDMEYKEGLEVTTNDVDDFGGEKDRMQGFVKESMDEIKEPSGERINYGCEIEEIIDAETYPQDETHVEDINDLKMESGKLIDERICSGDNPEMSEFVNDMLTKIWKEIDEEVLEKTETVNNVADGDMALHVNSRIDYQNKFENEILEQMTYQGEDSSPSREEMVDESDECYMCHASIKDRLDEDFDGRNRPEWHVDDDPGSGVCTDDLGVRYRGTDAIYSNNIGGIERDNGMSGEMTDMIEGEYEYDEDLVELTGGKYAYYDEAGLIEGDYEYDGIFEGLTGEEYKLHDKKVDQGNNVAPARVPPCRRFSFSTTDTSSMASILWVPVAFLAFSGILYWLSTHLPALDEQHKVQLNSTSIAFPSNLEELQSLATLLSVYKTTHFSYVLVLFSTAYIFKQTFAIPGSVFMNLLGGALFGQWLGFALACVLSASGATCCFILAKLCGKEYIVKYFPHYLNTIQQKIEENLDSLFFFLLFLRLFPMTPNWFLNMASPMCGIPIHLFFLSVLVGLMPYNFLCVQTGCFLSQLTSMDNILTWWTILKLFGVANAALLPGILIKHYHDQRQQRKQKAKES